MTETRVCSICGSFLGNQILCPKCGTLGINLTTARTTDMLTSSNTGSPSSRGTLDPTTMLLPTLTSTHTVISSSTIGTATTPPQSPTPNSPTLNAPTNANSTKFQFLIQGVTFELENIDDEINSQFRSYYTSQFGGTSCDLNQFILKCKDFFNSNGGRGNFSLHDRFFQNFYIIWRSYLQRQLYDKAEELWKWILNTVYEWEDQNNNELHKGTPYYFWAVTCILNKKIDDGFLLMHQALDEDKKTHNTQTPNTPAYNFVIMDPTPTNQFFREKVIEISNFIETTLSKYRTTRSGQMSFLTFQSKYLKQPISTIQNSVFYFIYGIFRFKTLSTEIYPKIVNNDFSSLLHANALFDMCLVLDAFIQTKYATPSTATFGRHLNFLSSTGSHGLRQPLSLAGKVSHLRTEFINNFSNTLSMLLTGNFIFQGGSTLNPIDQDFAIAYGIRNFGGHRIECQPVINANFEELSQRILNALFFLVENCP